MTTYVIRKYHKNGINYRAVLKRDPYREKPDKYLVEVATHRNMLMYPVWRKVPGGEFNNETDAIVMLDEIFGDLK